MIKAIFDPYGGIFLALLFLILFIAESKFELRKRVQNRWKRIVTNFIVAIPAFLLLRLLFMPAMVWLALQNQHWNIGLNYMFEELPQVKLFTVFLLLDYSNYAWHILLHKLPILWRFHLVHHTDKDLDLTTAFRFHFGELIASVVFRGTAVILTGASPLMILIYEIVFEAATQFHHSNLKLNFRFEKLLNKVFVTPRMHGIHHSVVQEETDSNYSVIFSFWDKLHKTIRLNISQEKITIGAAGYEDERRLTIGQLLKLPFTKIRDRKYSDIKSSDDFGNIKK